HRARASRRLAHEIQAPVDAIGAIHIRIARRTEHHGIALGLAAIGMRRRVGVVIGLELDDHAAGSVEQQSRADQLGRNLVDAAVEEAFAEAGHGESSIVAFSYGEPLHTSPENALEFTACGFSLPERAARSDAA